LHSMTAAATAAGLGAGLNDRLLMLLLKVGRALQDRQITPERAQMLEGLLDSLMPREGVELEEACKIPPASQLPMPYTGSSAVGDCRQAAPERRVATRISPPPTPTPCHRHVGGASANSPPAAHVVSGTPNSKPPWYSPPPTPPLSARHVYPSPAGKPSSPPPTPTIRFRKASKDAQASATPAFYPAGRSRLPPRRDNSLSKLKGSTQDLPSQPHSARGSHNCSPTGRPPMAVVSRVNAGNSTPRGPPPGSSTPRTAVPETGGTNSYTGSAISPRSSLREQPQYPPKPVFRTGLSSSSRTSSLRRGGC